MLPTLATISTRTGWMGPDARCLPACEKSCEPAPADRLIRMFR